jgi:hypothetical protein
VQPPSLRRISSFEKTADRGTNDILKGGFIVKQSAKKVAIAWYRREDYEQIVGLMEDGDQFPPTYSDWLRHADQVVVVEESLGSQVIRVPIDPKSFSSWCATAKCRRDAEARTYQLAIALGRLGSDLPQLVRIAPGTSTISGNGRPKSSRRSQAKIGRTKNRGSTSSEQSTSMSRS